MKKLTSILTLSALAALPASAITVVIDYSATTSSFFDGSADGIAAQAAVDAAAADVSAAITSSLGAISAGDYVANGVFGPGDRSTADFTGSLKYTNPDTGVETAFTSSLPGDEFRIFAGARTLAGGTLGQGGSGGVGISVSTSTFPGELDGAVADGESKFNTTFGRGITTQIASLSGSVGSANYDVNFGPTIGHLWFDDDTTWNLDHNAASFAGFDLYSVALHEILHSIGLGSSDTWNANKSGSADWTGAEVIAEHGTGIGIIDSGSGTHITSGTMSTSIEDGAAQEVAMDPDVSAGERKYLTDLDLAFLRDMGYETIPEPSSTSLLALGGLGLILRRKRTS